METTPDTGVPTPSPVGPSPTPKPEPAGDALETGELQRLTADIAARLHRVCSELPDEEFSALVLEIARVRMRYEERVTPLRPEPPRRDD